MGFYCRTQSSADTAHCTLVSVRLQCDFNGGLPPLLKLLTMMPGHNPSPLPLNDCRYLKDSHAEGYFSYSGAAVVLLAALWSQKTYVLEIVTPRGVQGDVALYVSS